MKNRKLILILFKYIFLFFFIPSLINQIIYIFLLRNTKFKILILLFFFILWLLGLLCFFLVIKKKEVFRAYLDKDIIEDNIFSLEIKKLEKKVENLKVFLKKNSDIFFSIIHDIKNPLTVIGGYASAIIQFDSNFNEEKKKEFIKRISTEADRLNKIIRDYLNNLKQVDELENIQLHKVNIKNILEYFYNIYEIKTKEDKINFILNIEDRLPCVLANTEKIELVISNLILNALNFVSARGFIEIEAKSNNGFVLISISNNYDNIKEINENIIFEDFDKNSKFKLKYEDVGFKLLITKTIIDNLNGKIEIKKDEEKGILTLNFTLPIYKISKKVKKKAYYDSRKNPSNKKLSYF